MRMQLPITIAFYIIVRRLLTFTSMPHVIAGCNGRFFVSVPILSQRSENDSNSPLINGTTSDVVQKYVRKEKGTSLRESSLKAALHSSLSRTEVDGRRIDPPRVILLSLCRSCLSGTEDEKLPRIIDTHRVSRHSSHTYCTCFMIIVLPFVAAAVADSVSIISPCRKHVYIYIFKIYFLQLLELLWNYFKF